MRSVDDFLRRFRGDSGVLVSPRTGGFDAAFSRRMRTFATWMTSGPQVGLHLRARNRSAKDVDSVTRPDDPLWVFVGDAGRLLDDRIRTSKAIALSPFGGRGSGVYPPLEAAMEAVGGSWTSIHAGGPALRFPGVERTVLEAWCAWVARHNEPTPDEREDWQRLLCAVDDPTVLTSEDARRARTPTNSFARQARSRELSISSVALRAARGVQRCRSTGSVMGARKVAGSLLLHWVQQAVSKSDVTIGREVVHNADRWWMRAELAHRLVDAHGVMDIDEVIFRGATDDEEPSLWMCRLTGGEYGLYVAEGARWTVGPRSELMAELSPEDFAEASVWVGWDAQTTRLRHT